MFIILHEVREDCEYFYSYLKIYHDMMRIWKYPNRDRYGDRYSDLYLCTYLDFPNLANSRDLHIKVT